MTNEQYERLFKIAISGGVVYRINRSNASREIHEIDRQLHARHLITLEETCAWCAGITDVGLWRLTERLDKIREGSEP